ncbi:FtsK/SpoIIIE domain-containing protein, partial [Devosia sp.]|uniref:FtsK/SpoIIIE domain-containing protein n=1 Tax=Devosia sp. TaxID=1871048 RepID=UPI001AD274AA
MRDSLFFSEDERLFFGRVIDDGLLQTDRRGVFWWVVRMAIARSMQMEEEPDERFRAPPKAPSELKLEQITSKGKDTTTDDAFVLLLSLKHGEDLFEDNDRYVELLQRHARRGLELLAESWRPGTSFHDVLLDGLYYSDHAASPSETMADTIEFGILQRGLEQVGVNATLVGEPIQGPRLNRYRLTLATVEDYDRLRKGLEDLSFAIGLGAGNIALGRETGGERRVVLDVPRPSGAWKDVPWSPLTAALEAADGDMPVAPGVDVLGNAFVFDLAETPHLFVAGATGSGKSVCVNAILLSLLRLDRPPELIMIDPKGVDFADYDGLRLLRGRRVLTDMDEGVAALRALTEEMDARQAMLRDLGARNIAEAQQNGSELRRLVVVVDELADFMMTRSGADEPLIRLAQKACAVG